MLGVLWEEDHLEDALSGPEAAAAGVAVGMVGPAAAAGAVVAVVAALCHSAAAAAGPGSGQHLRRELGAERIALNALVYGRLPSISKRLSKAE